jgi:hypothetical protein
MGIELVTWIVVVVHDPPSCLVRPWLPAGGGADGPVLDAPFLIRCIAVTRSRRTEKPVICLIEPVERFSPSHKSTYTVLLHVYWSYKNY